MTAASLFPVIDWPFVAWQGIISKIAIARPNESNEGKKSDLYYFTREVI